LIKLPHQLIIYTYLQYECSTGSMIPCSRTDTGSTGLTGTSSTPCQSKPLMLFTMTSYAKSWPSTIWHPPPVEKLYKNCKVKIRAKKNFTDELTTQLEYTKATICPRFSSSSDTSLP